MDKSQKIARIIDLMQICILRQFGYGPQLLSPFFKDQGLDVNEPGFVRMMSRVRNYTLEAFESKEMVDALSNLDDEGIDILLAFQECTNNPKFVQTQEFLVTKLVPIQTKLMEKLTDEFF